MKQSQRTGLALACFASAIICVLIAGLIQKDKPMSHDHTLREATALLREGKYQPAHDLFLNAYEHGADPGTALAGAAECSYYREQNELALNEANTLLAKTNAADPRGYYIRGLLAERAKQIDDAIFEYRRAERYGDRLAPLQIAAIEAERKHK